MADVTRTALLRMDGWAGRHDYAVVVVGETPQRYRIKLPPQTDPIRLAGGGRWLRCGQSALVPKHAVAFDSPVSGEGAPGAGDHSAGVE